MDRLQAVVDDADDDAVAAISIPNARDIHIDSELCGVAQMPLVNEQGIVRQVPWLALAGQLNIGREHSRSGPQRVGHGQSICRVERLNHDRVRQTTHPPPSPNVGRRLQHGFRCRVRSQPQQNLPGQKSASRSIASWIADSTWR